MGVLILDAQSGFALAGCCCALVVLWLCSGSGSGSSLGQIYATRSRDLAFSDRQDNYSNRQGEIA